MTEEEATRWRAGVEKRLRRLKKAMTSRERYMYIAIGITILTIVLHALKAHW